MASIIAQASFSTEGHFLSDPWRVLEKKATGLPPWLRTAASAMSDASHSNSNGNDSSILWTTEFSISIFKC